MSTTRPMTLKEKEAWLRNNVAVPTLEDYQLFISTPVEIRLALVTELNRILLAALEFANSDGCKTFGAIGLQVYGPIAELQKRYSDYGICDSELYSCVAHFFGLNYSPAIYEFMRWPHRWMKV